MTTEQIEERIQEKQTAIANLEAAHKTFLEQFNRQLALNRDEYNKLLGAIDELKLMLNGQHETPPA